MSKSTMCAATSITSGLNITKRRSGLGQNYLLLWVDANIDLKNEDFANTLTQLRSVVREIDYCTTPTECIEFLNKMNDEKVFVISSGSLGQHLIPDIHDMAQVRAIYIFCAKKALHEEWVRKWPKIQDVFTSINPICESLKKVARECDHDTISMSFVPKWKTTTTISDQDNLDHLPPSFMYSTLFKEIILEINEHDSQSISDLVAFCHKKNISEDELKRFQAEYKHKSPIWWYSCESFLYPMLNYALRSLDMETMTKMSFFIRSLHLQLQELHKKQSGTYNKEFVVYRGQGLSHEDFQHLMDTIGGLLSFNNFLSTSTEQHVAMAFLQRSVHKYKENVGVLFIMTINPMKISTCTPFSFIDDYSAMTKKEKEILFSMHTVFRVDDIKQMTTDTRLWEVHLTLTDDNDPQLIGLMKCMKDDLCESTGWSRLGDLMIRVGDFNQAEQLYNQLLKNVSSDKDRAHICRQLGWVKYNQGQCQEAARFYEQSLEIKRRTLPENDPSFSPIYNNIGQVYTNMGEYSKALEFYEKDLEIRKEALGLDHPHLAFPYTYIGLVYNNMGEYSKALEFYEKGLEIRKKSLPSTHPHLAISYGCVGEVYQNMGEYSKTLEFYEKTRQIFEQAYHTNHPDLAVNDLNFAAYYEKIGDYTAALKALENALKIQQKTFEENNPEFSFTYNRFGRIYRGMKEYPKALDYFQKSLTIHEKTLPAKHPNLGLTFSDIGDIHRLLGDYEKALSFHKKALNIQENDQCNPLECATTYVNLGETYRDMKDYTTALTYYQKGMKIREKKLSNNHPDLAVVYHNLADLYLAIRDYSMAMYNIQQALEIAQEKLSENHPHRILYQKTCEEIEKKL